MSQIFVSPARLGLALAALALGCHDVHELRPESSFEVHADTVVMTAAAPVGFDTAPAVEGPALTAPPVTGRVSTIEALTAPVFAPIGGRVIEALVRLGDRVKRGDKLVQLRSPELPLLQQEIEASGAAVRAKQGEIARLERMLEARVGSGHDLMLARAELERLQIAERAARSRLSSLAVAQAKDAATYYVLAPRDGAVVQIDALAGQVVGPERSSPLATIASIDEVFVIGDVPERRAGDLVVGATARVGLGAGEQNELVGSVEFVSEVVDPDRQTVPVRVRMHNEKRLLRPNAFVELTFDPLGGQSVLRVPTRAVVSDGPRSVVFVETSPAHFQRRVVKVGRQTGEWSELRAGVEPNEKIVVNHALLLLNAVDGES